MAYEDSNAGMPVSAHPMANPGYGKRSAPEAIPGSRADFTQLRPRAAYIAAFIDALPEGAAMDAKSLAKTNPLYGQMAVRAALNELSRAGHLRRVRHLLKSADGGFRWVYRTLWSRTAQDDEWWSRHLGADAPEPLPAESVVPLRAAPEAPEAAADVHPDPVPRRSQELSQPQRSERTRAYETLAQLAAIAPQLTLSAADCTALQDLAAEWLTRGADLGHLTRALTADLPDPVRAPRAFVRHRLLDKLPPLPRDPMAPRRPTPRTIMECTKCGIPGRVEALPGGLCRGCRNAPTAGAQHPSRTDVDVRTYVAQLRATLTTAP